jgi:hypothetical protein
MALIKSKIPISFAQGINTKIDPKQASIGTLEKLENVVFDEPGAIRKRSGYDKLSSSISGESTTLLAKEITKYKPN